MVGCWGKKVYNEKQWFYEILIVAYQGSFLLEGAICMSEKRRDNRNRVLYKGESQKKNGLYVYKYVDMFGKPKYEYCLLYTSRCV